MKYSLRSLLIAVILTPPLVAGGWRGYWWLFPPASSLPPGVLPPALPELSAETLKALGEQDIGTALFGPNGPPTMHVDWWFEPNPPERTVRTLRSLGT